MPLKITKASEPIQVETLTCVVYAPPGVGKSSMGFTAERPLLLDFDLGAHRARNRDDIVRMKSWAEVDEITADDLADYQTIVIDTAGRALDCLTLDIISRNPKMGRGGGALTLQGFGELKSRFVGWMKMIRGLGKDVVMLVHMDEQKSGDDTLERLDMQGASKNEIYKVADTMGRIQMVPGKRFGVLNFNPSDTAFGKNPAQLDPITIPDYATEPNFLAGVIRSIKDALNEMTEAQREEMERLASLRQEFAELESAEDFTEKANAMHDAPRGDKAILMAAAKDKGFSFNRETNAFEAQEAE